jgi:hypothetical protein
MKASSLFGIAILSTLSATPSRANFIPQMSLQRQLIAADLAVVGRLGERATCVVERQTWPCAEIQTDAALKGSPPALGTPRYLLLSSGFSEGSIEHMAPSGTVLMFLRAVRVRSSNTNSLAAQPDYYQPVQAYRSILPVDDQNNR